MTYHFSGDKKSKKTSPHIQVTCDTLWTNKHASTKENPRLTMLPFPSYSLPTDTTSLHITTCIINENYHTIFALIITQADYPNAMRGMLANKLEGNMASQGRCGLLTLAFAQ
jgi:hypothetical protein